MPSKRKVLRVERTSPADEWRDVPVTVTFLSGKPRQSAVNLLMDSIEDFCIDERVRQSMEQVAGPQAEQAAR